MTKMKDIQKKNDKDLVAFVEEKREEVRSFRFGTAGAGTRDVRKVRDAKKDIARGLTEQTVRIAKTNDVK
ncbi:MAG: ribosomal protein L29 [Candidatus Azotimanducaceae bacterium]|jgi:ribosomal protein L29